MNPFPYMVTTHGEEMHLDQNEKVVMYGMLLLYFRYSQKMASWIYYASSKKNAKAIYDCHF